ncbi:MAG: hypothetical protein L0Y54_11295 [Sporichthyaceae bacterium]|nr:hypothetical protein [Sporichthyaceae bacterium]
MGARRNRHWHPPDLRHTVGDWDWLPRIAAGWHICLDVAEQLLDGNPIGPIRGQDALRYGWDELRAGYIKRLGDPTTD